MNSSKSKRTRKKVTLHCRKLSSSNRSHLSSSFGAAGSYKRRISSLSKNNKMLAVTLEDVRCELSTTKNCLNGAVEYMNRIKVARFKMTQMQSVLSSFVKDFDEALHILKYDDIKWPELEVPTRLHKNFKNNMGKVSESIEKTSDCVSTGGAVVNSGESSSAHVSSNLCSTSNAFCTERAERVVGEIVNQPVEEDCIIKNISSNETENAGIIPEVLSTETFCEDSKGTNRKEERNALKNVTPIKNNENTPKLNISMQTATDLEASPKLKSNFSQKSSPQLETVSKKLPTQSIVLSSQKPHVSKIPRFQDIPDNLKRPIELIKKSKEKTTKKRKLVEKTDSNVCRRKTFVIKNSKTLSNDKSCTTLNENFPEEKEADKNMLDVDNIVVKASDIQENVANSKSDRRKTFIKKASNNSESVINKRSTFVVSELPSIMPANNENINCTENCNIILDAAVLDDKALTGVNLHANDSVLNLHSDGNLITVESSDKVNHVLNNSADANTLKLCLKKIPNHDMVLNPRESNEVNTVSENLESRESVDDHKKQNEIEEENTKVIDTNVPSNNLSRVMENVEVIDISDNTSNTRSRKPVSYKLFLDSSDSEDEIIPVTDISFVKEVQSSIKTTPIRRHISKNKHKKVFVFDGKKRKSIIKKPVSKNSEILPNDSKKHCKSSVNNIVDLEDQKMNSTKIVRFASNEQVCKNSLEEHPDSCNSEQKSPITPISTENCATINKEYKCSDTAIKDSGDMLNDVHNVAGPSRLQHENMSHYTMEDTTCKSVEVSADVENKAKKKHKAKNLKKNHNQPKDNLVIDDFSVTKRSKKINLEEGEIISKDIIETGLNDATKNLQVKVKKNKSKNKVRNELPYKKTGINTFLVHAEVHPPPPSSLKELEIEDRNKENEEILKLNNFEVSVVLKDILKSKNIDKINISCDKDLLPVENVPPKTPLSENSHNILLVQEKSAANVPENVDYIANDSEGTIKPRRQRAKKTYKEPPLNRKLRR